MTTTGRRNVNHRRIIALAEGSRGSSRSEFGDATIDTNFPLVYIGTVCDILSVADCNFLAAFKHFFVICDAIDRSTSRNTDYIDTRDTAIANKASLGAVEFHRLIVRKELYTTTIRKVVCITLDGKCIDY